MIQTTEVVDKARAAQQAAALLRQSRTTARDAALRRMAGGLRASRTDVLVANIKDVEASREAGATAALLDRLALNEARVDAMAQALEEVAALPDPLGEGESWVRPNGLHISKIRVPIGVIGIIYEARPNVTVEAASLAFKAGNAVVLRGSSSALETNKVLVALMRQALQESGLPPDAISLVEDTNRDVVDEMVRLNGLLDVVIPRGGDALIQRVVRAATVPVIETGVGNCHVYVDSRADLDKAERIVVNAKTHRPAVCNAAESLLVHGEVAAAFLPRVGRALIEKGVELRGCPRT
ncbi:MAG: glutamate-5-semialdehyde dehydrogenase, partial [Armatimonadetes bacterium]|nr:glutamate-5-semialdehyde dehydrogenase [Armatimonadota bacterium]